ncbi:MAG: AAA family ATPase [Nanoarchaeota archaeon]
MKFKKIKLRNIRSYKEEEIEFPDSSFLLAGDVGSGKSTILLAIEYALFGLQAGQKGSALLRNNEEEGEVILECEINGLDIIIERKLKKDKKTVVNDYAALSVNGEKREFSTTELKSEILNLLAYPSEFIKKTNSLYKYTVYTPQEQMKNIITEDPEKRLSLLRYVFGIDKYKRIRENLEVLVEKLKDEIKTLQLEVRLIEEEKTFLASVKSKIEILNARIKENREEIRKKVELRKVIEMELDKIAEKIQEKEQIEIEIEKTKMMIGSKTENIMLLSKEEEEALETLSNPGKKFDEKEYLEIIGEMNNEKENLEKLNSQFLSSLASLNSIESKVKELAQNKERVFSIEMCPMCLQDVPHAHKHNISLEMDKNIVSAKKQKQEKEEESKRINEAITTIKERLSILELKKSELEIARSKFSFIEKAMARTQKIQDLKKSLQKDIALLNQHISGLKEQSLKLAPFQNIHLKKTTELKLALIEEKRAEITLAESNKELELSNIRVKELENSIEKKEFSRIKLNSLHELSGWLSTQFSAIIDLIERQVMIKLREEFSRFFNSWFHMLAGDSFEVQLDENFTPLIILDGVEMDYSFISGGERTAIALAYRLALNQTINSVHSTIRTKDIIILDEPTEGFSEAQVDKIRDVLEQLDVRQLIIVSHETKIESFVDELIEVRKLEGVSRAGKRDISIPKNLNTDII